MVCLFVASRRLLFCVTDFDCCKAVHKDVGVRIRTFSENGERTTDMESGDWLMPWESSSHLPTKGKGLEGLKEPATRSCPESVESNPYFIFPLSVLGLVYLSVYIKVYKMGWSFQLLSPQMCSRVLRISDACAAVTQCTWIRVETIKFSARECEWKP